MFFEHTLRYGDRSEGTPDLEIWDFSSLPMYLIFYEGVWASKLFHVVPRPSGIENAPAGAQSDCLRSDFDIFVTNEEKSVMETLGTEARPLSSFTEHDQVIINNLIRKSVISKIVVNKSSVMVMKNDF